MHSHARHPTPIATFNGFELSRPFIFDLQLWMTLKKTATLELVASRLEHVIVSPAAF